MDIEPLSLATFDPAHAQAPYLNTPRSIEACRVHGVQPVELVEIPIDEFRKDFPDDLDAAQRRFERLDGARRRILNDVIKEWHNLCHSGWKPEFKAKSVKTESIIDVPDEAYCTLLEIQANRFRNLEKNQIKAFQRMLQVELKSAAEDIQHKKVIAKHKEMKLASVVQKQDRKLLIDALFQEQLKAKHQKEEEESKDLNRLKKIKQEELIRKKEDQEKQAILERLHREEKELNRVQQQEYTKGKREFILQKMDTMFEQRKQVQIQRDELAAKKLRNDREFRDHQIAVQHDAMEQRIAKAQADKEKFEAQKRAETLRVLEEAEAKQRRAEEALQERAQSRTRTSDLQEKIRRGREAADALVQERVSKVQAEVQLKEILSKQELAKVQGAQEKRRTIKMIRQEAFELAALRKKKAEEHRLQQIEQAIALKNARSEAIRKGYRTLEEMRREISHGMSLAKDGIKEEIAALYRKDALSPEEVAQRALAVTDHTLFPMLAKRFTDEAQLSQQAAATATAAGGLRRLNSASGASRSAAASRAVSSGDGEGVTGAARGEGAFLTAVGGDSEMGGSLGSGGSGYGFGYGSGPLQSAGGGVGVFSGRVGPDAVDISVSQSTGDLRFLESSQGAGGRSRSPARRPTTGSSSDHTKLQLMPLRTLTRDVLADKVSQSKSWVAQHLEEEEASRKNGVLAGGTSASPDNKAKNRPPGPPGAMPAPPHSAPANPSADAGFGVGVGVGSASLSSSGPVPMPGQGLQGNNHNNNMQLFPLYSYSYPQSGDDEFSAMGSESISSGIQQRNQQQQQQQQLAGRAQGSASSLSRDSGGGFGGKNNGSRASTSGASSKTGALRPVGPGEFRREYSLDHPLAGGKGKYRRELDKGQRPSGTHAFGDKPPEPAAQQIERLSVAVHKMVVDPEQQLDQLRREQNAALLRVLDDERRAEDEREAALQLLTDERERRRMELLFAEERRLASERIIRLTKEHDTRIREAVMAMMELGPSRR